MPESLEIVWLRTALDAGWRIGKDETNGDYYANWKDLFDHSGSDLEMLLRRVFMEVKRGAEADA